MRAILSDYIESMLNPNGRFRQLEGIYPVLDSRGEPVMVLTEKTADFEVVFKGCSYFLRCLLDPSPDDVKRLKEVSIYSSHIDSPFILPSVYFENEMLVFDRMNNSAYTDVILQAKPNGTRLDEFLASNAEKTEAATLKIVLSGLAEMCLWLTRNDFAHGNINSRNIYVTPLLKPVLVNYIKADRKIPHEDIHTLALIAACVYITICHPTVYLFYLQEKLMSKVRMKKFPQELLSIIKGEESDELFLLLDALAQQEESAIILADLLLDLSYSEPKNYDSLWAFLEKLSVIISEQARQAGEQMARYSFIGEMHDMLLRAREGDFWCYLDRNGEVLISGNFLSASDFDEGRAVVETESGYGMIDKEGSYILKPVYEDIEWDSMYNLAVVTTSEGKSGFYSREGEPLSEHLYDRVFPTGEEGISVVMIEGKYGYADRSGNPLTAIIYDEACNFHDGFGTLKLGNRIIIVDRDGEIFTDEENPASGQFPF